MTPGFFSKTPAFVAAFSLSLFFFGEESKADTFTPYAPDKVPQTVEALWADIDPAAEPLDVEVIKEWEEEGITYRYLLYTVCTFEDTPCRVSALYIFPTGASQAPAFVWSHGGGQRADQKRGQYFASQGYASIDINWGGREVIEGVEENTDWGTLDPSQGPQFYPGALRKSVKLNLDPDEHTIDAVPSPRNGNWFLLALAGRRAITFLEQQPEVDPERIGFTGYSMGGNITSYCSIDPRLKASAPMVGGTGFKMEDFPGIPDSSYHRQYRHHDLFSATIDSEAYWPLVKCPVLFLNATNDFHGILDRSYRCVELLPHDNWNATYNLHYNHSLRSEQYAALKLFFDEHLAGKGTGLPDTPSARLDVNAEGTGAIFISSPDLSRTGELVSIEVLYSHDPNPRTRHWKTATTNRKGDLVGAELPIRENLPLLAFANLTYRIAEPFEAFEDTNKPAEEFTITSDLATFYPDSISFENLRSEAKPTPVFHDFRTDGLTGWGTSSRRNSLRTYRFQDPDRATPGPDEKLVIQCSPVDTRQIIRIRLEKNRWIFPQEGGRDS
ncbi:MAG: dienelactone hydrolase family protein, partial [Verrucomicrobiota bacterium]